MAFAPARPGEVSAVEFGPGAAEVVCRAESLVAVEAGVRGEVSLVRRIVEAGSRTTLAMIRPVRQIAGSFDRGRPFRREALRVCL